MIVTPAGLFENSLFHALTVQGDPTRIRPGHPYYDSLYRMTSRAHFDRCATFIALAEELVLVPADWGIPSTGRSPPISLEQFGIRFSENWGYARDGESLAALLLAAGAFSTESLSSLRTGVAPESLKRAQLRKIDGVEVDEFAVHHLTRLLGQVRLAADSHSKLILGTEEQLILKEISSFVEVTQIPTPFDLPEMRRENSIDAENFAGGLFNFSPPDALSAAAVRGDPSISKYAAKVRALLASPATLDSQRGLVAAMRTALENSEAARRVETVFEVESWIAKPLHYIPVLGEALTLLEDGIELGKKWISRKRSEDEWFLLSPKMSEVSIKDYLRRTNNL